MDKSELTFEMVMQDMSAGGNGVPGEDLGKLQRCGGGWLLILPYDEDTGWVTKSFYMPGVWSVGHS